MSNPVARDPRYVIRTPWDHMEEKGQFPKGIVVLFSEEDTEDDVCEEWRLVVETVTSLVSALLSCLHFPGAPEHWKYLALK